LFDVHGRIKMVRLFQIRKITQPNKEYNTTYGITIPRYLVKEYENVWFNVVASGPNIVLESGNTIELKK